MSSLLDLKFRSHTFCKQTNKQKNNRKSNPTPIPPSEKENQKTRKHHKIKQEKEKET